MAEEEEEEKENKQKLVPVFGAKNGESDLWAHEDVLYNDDIEPLFWWMVDPPVTGNSDSNNHGNRGVQSSTVVLVPIQVMQKLSPIFSKEHFKKLIMIIFLGGMIVMFFRIRNVLEKLRSSDGRSLIRLSTN